MNKIELLTAGAYQPGLYQLLSATATSEIQAAVANAGWRFGHLDGRTIQSKADFLTAVAAVLHFPPYFGHNWDAFEECIQDLSWLSAPGYVLLYEGVAHFAQQQPAEWRTARAILTAAAAQWRTEGRPIYFLVRETANVRFDLEWL
ncbi:MAG: barstar family protein [Caldilineaceae bacterium]|nr:barstar family protein [Caldilineaceae bacterium]